MIAAVLAALLAAPQPVRYAVSIGHNGSPDADRPALRYADDDAARFHELLSPTTAGAWLLTTLDAESQELFPGLTRTARPPTRAALAAALAELRGRLDADRRAGRRTELVFYYAGHGDVHEGEGRVALADGWWTRADLRREVLEGARADRIHVVVDACKSYFLVGGRGPGGRREPYPGRYAAPAAPAHVGYVLSTSSDADAHEWAALPGGVFSHEVRSALVGGADADADGAVTYDELAAFVGVANEAVPVPRYRPRVFIRAPRADRAAVIFRPAELPASTRLEVGPDRGGRITVIDQRGLRYAELHKARGAALWLSLLTPRRYEVRVGDERYAVEARGGHVPLDGLPPATGPEVRRRSVAHRALEHLFARPFGPDVVRGYRLGATAGGPAVAASGERPTTTGWVAPALLGVGVAALGGGVGLGLMAADERVDAAAAAQVDRASHDERARAYAWGAGAAVTVGVAALATAVWLYATEP